MTPPSSGLTVRDVARRYRVSPDRVRAWIARGELAAINTRDVHSGRPRFVVLPEALTAFEQARAVSPPPKPHRRKKKTGLVDYFPDEVVA